MKKKILIAFDVDKTLRCDCQPTCAEPHQDIVTLARILGTMKNVRLMVWSGGGKDYATNAIARYDIPGAFPASKIDQNTWVCGKPDIAFDDVETFNMATINLIVGDYKHGQTKLVGDGEVGRRNHTR
jgi:hypothetical protein